MRIIQIESQVEKAKVEHGIWIVVIAWLAVNLSIYFLFGIQTGLESKKYIKEALLLIETGSLSELRYHFYFGIIGILYTVKLLGLGLKSAIGIQLILSLSAHLYLYEGLKKTTSNNKSIYALVLIILAPSFEYWNWTLYSESIFFSAILFFIGSCIRSKPSASKIIFSQGLLLGFCIISRPSGVLLAIPWILYVIQTNYKYWSWRIAAPYLIAGGAVLIVISNAILGTISDWNVMDPFTKGFVVCNISEYTQDRRFSLTATTPIGQLIEFTSRYPSDFLNLSFQKLFAFFIQYRTYYSQTHNIYIITYSALTLSLFLRSICLKPIYSPLTTLFYSTITLWTFSIIFQCDDYHSRFYNSIIPVMIIVGLRIKKVTI
jgi:hypothetical protein